MTTITIDITPKWADLVSVLTELAVNGKTYEARATAREELMRLAKYADSAPGPVDLTVPGQYAVRTKFSVYLLDVSAGQLPFVLSRTPIVPGAYLPTDRLYCGPVLGELPKVGERFRFDDPSYGPINVSQVVSITPIA
jgi:hypothetical protein